MKHRQPLVFSVLFFLTVTVQSQELHVLAKNFLNSLSPELREATVFDLTDEERHNFYYTPVYRKGTALRDYDAPQKKAALKLLRASISKKSYKKVEEIRSLESILKILENDPKMSDGSAKRDPLNYHFWIFGSPEKDKFWGWRFEGHHISLNFVASDGLLVSSTPFFLGSNPGRVLSGEHKGKEVLKQETALGYALANALSEEQLAIARFSKTAPADVFTANHPKANRLDHKGISYAALNDDQKKAFSNLLQLYLDNYEAKFSKSFKKKIQKAGMDELSFSWAGSLEKGEGHYYNIQGPTVLIEYDNTQNNNNHVHAVIRDFENDFGEDILKMHYEKDHTH
ncbi:DUF3500 domain-containing protein [Pareuzebyella sediminis]|uniref:DUF3500 domain-containing protein n=1 Tax=Pareuzebyella sediminis TaxID=2607998 RepID=UPI0011EC1D1C|nr:DUF3500 domain-containing protein [Pareuzebyella sediminis]